jgi:hypothetical protein
VHAIGGEHVGADELVERAQKHSAAADLVGERRDAKIDILARVALGLPIERLASQYAATSRRVGIREKPRIQLRL